MSAHRLLERPRRAAQLPLRQAHVEGQAGEPTPCFRIVSWAPSVVTGTHKPGDVCRRCGFDWRRVTGRRQGRQREARAQQLVAMVGQHNAQSALMTAAAEGHAS